MWEKRLWAPGCLLLLLNSPSTIPAWDVCLTTHLLQAHGAAPSPGPLLLSYVLRRSTPLPKDEVWVWDRVGVEALCHSLFQQRARIGRGKR